MKPLPAPLLRRQVETDPLHEAVGEAMHSATIQLWGDLWRKLEQFERNADRIDIVAQNLQNQMARMPNWNGKGHVRNRVAKLRAELAELRP